MPRPRRRRKPMKMMFRLSVLALLASLSLAVPALAQDWKNESGKIVSTDWNKMEMELLGRKDRVATWKVARDCEVKFSDKKEFYPNPTYKDLRAPMYVFFLYEAGTILIKSVEVREVGFDPAKGGPGVEQKATITNLDATIGHVEVDLGTSRTFEVDPKSQLTAFKVGDRVTLLIETREGGREVVTKITKEPGTSSVPRRRQ
jgi:hypothetical protein